MYQNPIRGENGVILSHRYLSAGFIALPLTHLNIYGSHVSVVFAIGTTRRARCLLSGFHGVVNAHKWLPITILYRVGTLYAICQGAGTTACLIGVLSLGYKYIILQNTANCKGFFAFSTFCTK